MVGGGRAGYDACMGEPSAFERVVPTRVVRRIIRRHRRIGGFGREVPHEHGYAEPQ